MTQGWWGSEEQHGEGQLFCPKPGPVPTAPKTVAETL